MIGSANRPPCCRIFRRGAAFGFRSHRFSYAVPDAVLEDQDQLFFDLPANIDGNPATGENITRYAINFSNSSDVYQLGPSYALNLTDKLAVG